MRVPRLYVPLDLSCNEIINLDQAASRRLSQVLRLKLNHPVRVFNGHGGEYLASITAIEKRQVQIQLTEFDACDRESPLDIHVGQGVSRGDKMDFAIQKSVELGATKLTAIFSERCEVQLDGKRLQKKLQHWQAIAISACEQCGRNTIPEIAIAVSLSAWLQQQHEQGLVLNHRSVVKLAELSFSTKQFSILIGPEGGLTTAEIASAIEQGFTAVKLGPRILRTETAALVALTSLQQYWGDL